MTVSDLSSLHRRRSQARHKAIPTWSQRRASFTLGMGNGSVRAVKRPSRGDIHMTVGHTTLGRSCLLAATVAAGLMAGASGAAADGPPGKNAGWPNTPWHSWSGLYGGIHVGSVDAWW